MDTSSSPWTQAVLLSQERGHTKSLMVGNVECFAWQDKKQINFLNTITDPQQKTTVKRKKKDGSSINVECPESVKLYNANIGGVDNADAKRKVYSCSRCSKKWWMRIFYFGLDVAVVNAHIVQQNTPNCPKITQKEFRMELAKEPLSMHSVYKIFGEQDCGRWPFALHRTRLAYEAGKVVALQNLQPSKDEMAHQLRMQAVLFRSAGSDLCRPVLQTVSHETLKQTHFHMYASHFVFRIIMYHLYISVKHMNFWKLYLFCTRSLDAETVLCVFGLPLVHKPNNRLIA